MVAPADVLMHHVSLELEWAAVAENPSVAAVAPKATPVLAWKSFVPLMLAEPPEATVTVV